MNVAAPGLQLNWPTHEPRPSEAPLPLEGVRIVDFSHFAAGPLATMILAGMGADVIKVEPPSRGEDFRHYPPMHPTIPGCSAPFFWANRTKRSVGLNLKSPAGADAARRLIERSDVVVENFSAQVMKRFGLDFERCSELNPALVYCSVSAYGRNSAYADRLGFDPVAQAECGIIATTGYPDREGTRTLSSIVDIGTGMMAANAILGALMARYRTGKGQAVEVTLFGTGILMSGYPTMQYLFSGQEPGRNGNTSPDTSPSGVFRASDRSFYINCANDQIFHRLAVQVLQRPDLADDPGLCKRAGRLERRDELFAILGEVFAAAPWAHWKPLMRAAAIPCGEVRTIGEALSSPEAAELDLVTLISHPEVGWMPDIRLPIHYSDTPLADPRPAPTVGEHTREVLAEVLGITDLELDAMACDHAFEASERGAQTAARAEDEQ
jgi:crotonobetainyl-CoA:carnitine CoA-transferase CaiB-like acyl-CoA transferase